MSTDDWPHDPDGEQGSEGRRQYGHAVLAKKIDDAEDFPLRAGDYVDEFGDHPVRLDEETVVSVADIFADIDDDREFDDFVEFHQAVGQVMREGGFWTYEGSEAFA